MNNIIYRKVRLLVTPILGAVIFSWLPIQTSGSSFVDPFTPIDLGVGGDQHFTAANPSFFSNIVASAVGDLDNDGNQDIVLLANSVPPNGAYKPAGTNFPDYTLFWLNPGTFLNSGDLLFGVDTGAGVLGPNFNQETLPQPWFKNPFF